MGLVMQKRHKHTRLGDFHPDALGGSGSVVPLSRWNMAWGIVY